MFALVKQCTVGRQVSDQVDSTYLHKSCVNISMDFIVYYVVFMFFLSCVELQVRVQNIFSYGDNKLYGIVLSHSTWWDASEKSPRARYIIQFIGQWLQ